MLPRDEERGGRVLPREERLAVERDEGQDVAERKEERQGVAKERSDWMLAS